MGHNYIFFNDAFTETKKYSNNTQILGTAVKILCVFHFVLLYPVGTLWLTVLQLTLCWCLIINEHWGKWRGIKNTSETGVCVCVCVPKIGPPHGAWQTTWFVSPRVPAYESVHCKKYLSYCKKYMICKILGRSVDVDSTQWLFHRLRWCCSILMTGVSVILSTPWG